MTHLQSRWLFVALLATLINCEGKGPPKSKRLTEVKSRLLPKLDDDLRKKGLLLGSPIFIRLFKQEKELEIWVFKKDKFHLFKTYAICNFSGRLGPKIREGDGQSPEGFYSVGASQLNPKSRFHLSFNLGFPNAYDRAHRRTGSFLMVHGDCVSIGCYAMGDANIEEIYLAAEAALRAGQSAFGVHAFPFRMTAANLKRQTTPRFFLASRHRKWLPFWENLKEGYDYFEAKKKPPRVRVLRGRYVFSD